MHPLTWLIRRMLWSEEGSEKCVSLMKLSTFTSEDIVDSTADEKSLKAPKLLMGFLEPLQSRRKGKGYEKFNQLPFEAINSLEFLMAAVLDAVLNCEARSRCYALAKQVIQFFTSNESYHKVLASYFCDPFVVRCALLNSCNLSPNNDTIQD